MSVKLVDGGAFPNFFVFDDLVFPEVGFLFVLFDSKIRILPVTFVCHVVVKFMLFQPFLLSRTLVRDFFILWCKSFPHIFLSLLALYLRLRLKELRQLVLIVLLVGLSDLRKLLFGFLPFQRKPSNNVLMILHVLLHTVLIDLALI